MWVRDARRRSAGSLGEAAGRIISVVSQIRKARTSNRPGEGPEWHESSQGPGNRQRTQNPLRW